MFCQPQPFWNFFVSVLRFSKILSRSYPYNRKSFSNATSDGRMKVTLLSKQISYKKYFSKVSVHTESSSYETIRLTYSISQIRFDKASHFEFKSSKFMRKYRVSSIVYCTFLDLRYLQLLYKFLIYLHCVNQPFLSILQI